MSTYTFYYYNVNDLVNLEYEDLINDYDNQLLNSENTSQNITFWRPTSNLIKLKNHLHDVIFYDFPGNEIKKDYSTYREHFMIHFANQYQLLQQIENRQHSICTLQMINAYQEMITSLTHSISQNEVADLCNIQLLNLQKFPINIPETAPFTLPHDQYIALNKLTSTLGSQIGHRQFANNINEIINNLLPTTDIEIDSSAIDIINGIQLPINQTDDMFKHKTNLPAHLHIKIGSTVMFLNNTIFSAGICNGTIGIVREIQNDNIIVIFPVSNGIVDTIVNKTTTYFNLNDEQIFTYGQAYVSISRTKSLSTLNIRALDKSTIRTDPSVLEEYDRLLKKSQQLGF
ncbi:15988_t:CDS:2 [Cetraspora pellucida]|uniref:15988_t:CDS:1 n=1 Tax=Cetraspora pellucida TaxID=1433469 RepID=A0ACA9MDR4_9GLOM|nr:15988_t:CDS:2 [Cetraspora pellucida]